MGKFKEIASHLSDYPPAESYVFSLLGKIEELEKINNDLDSILREKK